MRIALLALLGAAACGCGKDEVSGPERPNVLVFVIDTLRADQLSCYGCPDNTTPNLDAFARENVRFQHAYAPSPMTAPSHASLFTSTYPATHGVWNEVPLQNGENAHPRLADSAVTLAEVLRDAGYATAAIADGGWIQKSRGLDQGFQHFHSKTLGVVDRVTAALQWLEQRRGDRPFFLFLHTYQVHAPYLPPPGYEERFAKDYQGPLRQVLADARAYADSGQVDNALTDIHDRFFKPTLAGLGPEDREFLRALYRAELSLVDEEFARLLGYLRLNGLLDHTIVMVTSDHGEEFGEHGVYTHAQVYDETLHVPLLVHVPHGPRGLVRSDPVDLVDLAPSLLGALGLQPPAAAQGRVLDLAQAAAEARPRPLVAENNHYKAQIAYREGPWKAVVHLHEPLGVAGRLEVYNLEDDPQERAPRAGAVEFEQRARDAIVAWRRTTAELRERFQLQPTVVTTDEMPEELRQELQALGYVGGDE